MAFDRSSRYEAADAAVDVNVELGRAYVEPGSENIELAVLDAARAELLSAWAATIIPGDDEWPSGSDVQAVGYVDRTLELAPQLRPRVLQVLDEVRFHALEILEREFGAASLEDRVTVLQAVEEQEPLVFTLLKELTYEAYYRDETVAGILRDRTGFRTRNPVDGVALEEFDEALLLLADVAERPSQVRQVDQ
jgi:hypothetical protein